MSEQPDSNNDVIFLGINFNNFFKNCGCIKRFMDDESVDSETEDRKKHEENEHYQKFFFEEEPQFTIADPAKQNNQQPPNINNINQENFNDGHSFASSTDWTDLEEVPLPHQTPPIQINPVPINDHYILNGNMIEEFVTQEPIDFNFIHDMPQIERDEDALSGLSKGSKKIAKESHPAQDKKVRPKSAFQKEAMNKDANIKGKRKPWQPHEDAQVLDLVGRYGQSWAVVASMMEGRTGKQIRDRYLNKLRPNIKKGDWTPEEDKHLLTLYYQLGHKWSKIATYLPGRTEGQVKNRFYSHIKKKVLANDGSDGMSDGGESNLQAMLDQQKENINGNMIQETPGSLMSQEDDGQRNFSRMQSPGRNYLHNGKNNLSPSLTNQTATTMEPKIHNERDLDDILDKAAGFMERKPEAIPMVVDAAAADIERMPIEEKMAFAGSLEGINIVDRVDRLEQLQKRRNKLEFLLAQTLKDMGMVNPPNAVGDT